MTTEPTTEPTTDPTTDLARLGDDLERATGEQLGRARRSRTLKAAGGLAAVALLLTATAAAAGLFTPRQVAASMPASAVIFGGTHPSCVLDADGSTYHCTLDSAPLAEDAPVQAGPKAGSGTGSGAMDYTGAKEPIAIDDVVAGGCIGRSADGLAWDCYIGQDAVDQLIIGKDFLGEPMTGPGRG